MFVSRVGRPRAAGDRARRGAPRPLTCRRFRVNLIGPRLGPGRGPIAPPLHHSNDGSQDEHQEN